MIIRPPYKVVQKIKFIHMLRALPVTKKTLNNCCYFSHMDLLTYALLFISHVSALVQSLIIQLFPYYPLSSVLPFYVHVPKPHTPHTSYHHQSGSPIITFHEFIHLINMYWVSTVSHTPAVIIYVTNSCASWTSLTRY